VHATLDYDGLLHPNGVRNMLSGITPHKHIFTNADAKHAAECLTRLRVEDCFEVRRQWQERRGSNSARRVGYGVLNLACQRRMFAAAQPHAVRPSMLL
jgi:hypothetical protein